MKPSTILFAAILSALTLPAFADSAQPAIAASGTALQDARARHDHMRDAKQGYASSRAPREETAKPLHDHRQFK